MTTSARRLATLLALITALVAYAAPAQASSSSNSLAQVLNASRAVQRQPALPVSQALASPQAKMYAAMNAARTRSGLPAASISRILTIASTRYAQALAKHHLFQHAAKIRSRGFSVVGEILARSPGRSPMIDPIVNAWLDSPVHRPILLGGQYQSVGLGMAEARYGGQQWTVWVVRFGER
jgi:uncharacterized protein YkwD